MTKKKTSKEESLEWAQQAYDKLKNKKPIKFRSGLEEKVADLLEGLGVSYQYESERVPYTIQHNYTPDFALPNHVLLETKGYWDAADRRKIAAVKKDNPDLDLRMVFQAPYNKISKHSSITYVSRKNCFWIERISLDIRIL